MHAPDPAPTPDPSSRALFLRVFPSVMLPMFLAMMDQTIVATALPAIAGSLGGVERVSWVVVSYLIATTVAAPVYGARPLRRYIQREVESRIGRALLTGDVHDGAVCTVDVVEGSLEVRWTSRGSEPSDESAASSAKAAAS